ncbi:hypothetical protein ANO11243_093460 [Dothideomycetidae sp. 11243]|nr:hypothetical protein ANO11243_093460 [fungal sp. No.11243]
MKSLRSALSGAALLLLLCHQITATPIMTSIAPVIAPPIATRIAEVGLNDTNLLRRALGNTEQQPIDKTFDITGWTDMAEQNFYAMLCMRGSRVLRRNPDPSEHTSGNRQAAGTNSGPFKQTKVTLRKTDRINDATTSAEEFPWASTEQGGRNAYLFPATVAEQNGKSKQYIQIIRFADAHHSTRLEDRSGFTRIWTMVPCDLSEAVSILPLLLSDGQEGYYADLHTEKKGTRDIAPLSSNTAKTRRSAHKKFVKPCSAFMTSILPISSIKQIRPSQVRLGRTTKSPREITVKLGLRVPAGPAVRGR